VARLLIPAAPKCYYGEQGDCARHGDILMTQEDTSPLPPRSNDRRTKRVAKIILAVVFIIGVSIAFYHVMKEILPHSRMSGLPAHERISLRSGNEKDLVPGEKPGHTRSIRIAIAPIVSPEKSMEMYEPFINYVGKKLGREPIALYRQTYSETNDLVRYQRCDIAIVCTYPFIRGEREFGMQALVVPQIKGEVTYQSFILVPHGSPARSLLDLRGKRFASADIISTTGWLYPAMLLMDAGENPNKFFGEHVITGSHDRSLQAVIDGFVDGAAVHGIVFSQIVGQDPSVLQNVRVLAISNPFGIPPIVAHPDLDSTLKKDILSVLLSMHEDAEGKSILEKLQIDRFVVPPADLFAPLRLAISKLERWRQ